MTRDHDTPLGLPPIPVVRGIGLRLLLWIATLFLATLAIFVGLDVLHESEVMRRRMSLEATGRSIEGAATVIDAPPHVSEAGASSFVSRGDQHEPQVA